MKETNELAFQKVLDNMSEGVMTLGRDGTIMYINPAAEKMLSMSAELMLNKKFGHVFIEYEENDSFNQAVLDAVYDPQSKHENLVPYYNGEVTKQIHIVSSYLYDGEERAGIIVVLGDITELAELKIRYSEQITILLDSLVQALSTAIEARSHYNAKHTQNMGLMASAFLNSTEGQRGDWKLDNTQRHAFLMSVWLHDIGKLVVPLKVMDKADRLGGRADIIKERFIKVKLLNKIAAYEGRSPQHGITDSQLDEIYDLIMKINTSGFLTDEMLERVGELAKMKYEDVGGVSSLFTKEEITALSVRKGTLTDEERAVMQSHVTATKSILSQVLFPEAYEMIPFWASCHHELLNGKGYPDHLKANEIPKEVRLLTILDIFEALTSSERPYKKAMSPEKAFDVLGDMAKEGSIDGELLEMFRHSNAWRAVIANS